MSQVRLRAPAALPTRRPNTQMKRSRTRVAKAGASATIPRTARPFGFGTSRPVPPWSAPPAAGREGDGAGRAPHPRVGLTSAPGALPGVGPAVRHPPAPLRASRREGSGA